MKKIILTAAAVFAFSFANAQEAKSFGYAKGNITIGGNITTETDKSTVISPQVDYFVSDKVSVGAGLTSTSGGDAESTTEFNLGVKYQILDLGTRFKVNTGANLGFGNDNTNFTIGVGIGYFLTQHLIVNWGLNDIISYDKPKAGDATTKIDLNDYKNLFDLGNFGLTYRF
jgi:outer membrane protein